MIKIIIGQNASGKTLYLDNVVEEMSQGDGEIDFVTNLADQHIFDHVPFLPDKVEILCEILQAERVDTSCVILTPVESPVVLGREFIEIITLLCKDVKAVYLDEPEQGLSEYEMSILCTLIQYFSRFFEEIIIVTHSELFVQMVNCRYFTVVMDEKTADVELIQVSEDDKFEIID